jgi:hypothetical protein
LCSLCSLWLNNPWGDSCATASKSLISQSLQASLFVFFAFFVVK